MTEAGSRIDFGYHFIISTEEQLAGVPRYATEFGAPSFKIFMNNRGGEGARLGLPDIDDGFLLRLCESGRGERRHGVPASRDDRACLGDCASARRPPIRTAPAASPRGTRAARPFVEADAVQRAAYIAGTAGCPLYVVHTSSAEALDAALRLRGNGPHGARRDVPSLPHARRRLARRRRRQDQSAAARSLRSRGVVGGHPQRQRRHGRDRSRASRYLVQGGRHLDAPRPAARASTRCCR